MTYSLPVMEEARSDAKNATSSATSSGRFGLPNGMRPSESIMRCLAASILMPIRCTISVTNSDRALSFRVSGCNC